MAETNKNTHPVWGDLHSPWDCATWEGEITVCFSKPSAGWIQMALMTNVFNANHIIYCSDVFNPFWKLVDWLNGIADDKLPASIEIDEEGMFTRLTVLPYDDNWLEFRSDRPSYWDEKIPGNSELPKRLLLCRLKKYQLLAEFHRRLKDFLKQDYDPHGWSARNWNEYEYENERYSRFDDLRRLDLTHLSSWLQQNKPKTMKIEKIVSGGQTGADRAALKWAIAHQIPHGGWCPTGRKAEDGTIPSHYALEEMADGGYRRRTKANVRDSDATLIISEATELTGGSKETALFAQRLAKPWLHVHPGQEWRQSLAAWLDSTSVQTLNVAGPRASKEPEVGSFVWQILDEVLRLSLQGATPP